MGGASLGNQWRIQGEYCSGSEFSLRRVGNGAVYVLLSDAAPELARLPTGL
jgi:hypothetical protein